MSLRIRSKGLGYNRKWDKQSQEAKNLLIENLPINYNLAILIFPVLIFLPIIIKEFFSINSYLSYFLTSLPIIYVLWLMLAVMYNYKKKTGRLLNKDIENIKQKEGDYK